MKSNRAATSFAVLCASIVRVAAADAAEPVFGAGLSMPGMFLRPVVHEKSWKEHGAVDEAPPPAPATGEADSSPPSNGEADSRPPSNGEADSRPPSNGEADSSPPSNGEADSSPPSNGEADSSPPSNGEADSSPPSNGEADSSPPSNSPPHRRAFSVRTSDAAGAPRISGTAVFSEAPGGAIRAEWTAESPASAAVAEFCLATSVPFADFGGGRAEFDGGARSLPLPETRAPAPHLFRDAVSAFSLFDRAGAERWRFEFDTPARILLQDSRHWNLPALTIRVFFAEGAVEEKRQMRIAAKISAPGSGPLALGPGGPWKIEPGPDWIPVVDEPAIEPGSALDFTAVVPHHRPAGALGRVVVRGGRLEFENRPGVPARFYGANVSFEANFPPPGAAREFAARFARVGYNSIRLHHHDGGWTEGSPDGTAPNPEKADRFDSLVAACIEEGLYVTTDLYVSRRVPWRALGFDREGTVEPPEYKVLCSFHEPAFSNLCAFARAFLRHENPYTGRCLAEEPGLATLALVNEGNLGNQGAHFLRRFPEVQAAWREWLAAKRAATGSAESGTFAGIPDTVPDSLYSDGGDAPAARHSAAFAQFLADREARFLGRFAAFVRGECDCNAPLSGLSSWYDPVQYQLARDAFDYVDGHAYVDHPSFLDEPWRRPSICPNENPLAGPDAGVPPVAYRRFLDKPFCLTEFNYSAPGRFRGVGGIAMGALGALQGWDGIWRFSWSHGGGGVWKPAGRIGYFDMASDPLALSAERAALCLFLRGDARTLAGEAPFALDPEALRDPSRGARKIGRPGFAAEAWRARVGTRLAPGASSGAAAPATEATAARPDGSPHQDRLPPRWGEASPQSRRDSAPASEAPGDDVETDDASALPVRISGEGSLVLDTPCTAGGFAESGAIVAGPLRAEISGAAATVWASSLDGLPLGRSSRILLTHLTDVQDSGTVYGDPGLRILVEWGKPPHLMRGGEAKIALKLDPAGGPAEWTVYPLSPSGRRLAELPSTFDPASGALSFEARTALDPASATWLYEIVRR